MKLLVKRTTLLEQRDEDTSVITTKRKMGRSQVERNQRLRSGGKGVRGGRGGKQSSRRKDQTQTKQDLGDNSFRYQHGDKGGRSTDDDFDGSDWDYSSSANVYGASHDVVDIPSYYLQNARNGMYEIDIAKLSACIDQMKSYEWMRFDNDRMLKLFNDRFSGNDDGKKTLTEWKASSEAISNSFSAISVTPTKKESNSKPIIVEHQQSENPSSTNSEMEKEKHNEEESLQDWLDGMIDT